MEKAGVKQYQNISPSKDHWLSCSSGVSGISFALIFLKNEVRVELNITSSDSDTNKAIFDQFLERKASVEESFGHELQWQRLDDKSVSCEVRPEAVDGYNEEGGSIDRMARGAFPKVGESLPPRN